MILTLDRYLYNSECTIGELGIDDAFECYTLEPSETAGKGCIPTGTYQVTVTWSPAFKQPMPLINDVPGFEGIRIHWGNTDADTAGCVLVGMQAGVYDVEQSRAAFAPLFQKIQSAINAGENVSIVISDCRPQTSDSELS